MQEPGSVRVSGEDYAPAGGELLDTRGKIDCEYAPSPINSAAASHFAPSMTFVATGVDDSDGCLVGDFINPNGTIAFSGKSRRSMYRNPRDLD